MKIRAVIAGLVLLMLVFYPVGWSHAAKSLRDNVNSYPPADEHPWQHGDAPDPGDNTRIWKTPRVIVVPILPSLKTVWFIPAIGVKLDSNTKVTSEKPDDDPFSGAR